MFEPGPDFSMESEMSEKEREVALIRANDLQAQLVDLKAQLERALDDEARYRWTCEIDDYEWELEELYIRLDPTGEGK